MAISRAGTLLLTLGVVVGVAASIGLILGFEPSRLPPALLNIAAYKLTFLAAGGLLAAGAIVSRYARRESLRASLTQGEPKALMEAQPVLDPLRTPGQPEHTKAEAQSQGVSRHDMT